LIRPALYGSFHQIIPVEMKNDREPEVVDVVGPVCETGDFLGRDRRMAMVREGELLAVLDAGAYGMSLSSNYNSRPRAAEVMVDGKSVKLIRKRETIADLMRNEFT
jgi:diaminopimelate decarboxylase